MPPLLKKYMTAEMEKFATDAANPEKAAEGDKQVAAVTDLFRPLPAADAFQVPHGRHALRLHPALARLHAWIHSHSDAGYVTRAEAVSMLPPLILDC